MSNDVILLVARILLGVLFILAGLGKFGDISGTAGLISSAGLPAGTLLAWLAAVFEVGAGLAILVGFQTKIVAWLLVAFCLFTGFMFHLGPINIPEFSEGANAMLSSFNQVMLMKNVAIAAGFLALVASGPGALSVDARRA
ncbi:MAG: DoxX family protein [Rhizobiaceae bacterium]